MGAGDCNELTIGRSKSLKSGSSGNSAKLFPSSVELMRTRSHHRGFH